MTEKVSGLTGREGVSFELRIAGYSAHCGGPRDIDKELDETRRQVGQPGREIDELKRGGNRD